MDELTELQQRYAELSAERDKLQSELQGHEQAIAALETELSETNRGVIALYAELDTYSLKLREAAELKTRFLTYMSHEFRTPLGAMQSISNILLQRLDGELTAEQEKQVKFIQKAAGELTDMVNDLLDLAKLEAGRVTIAPAWFEMVDLFSAIRGLFKPIIAQSGVSLIFDEPPDVPKLYTDDTKLSIILRNFVSNALKFTSQGEVRVRATCVEGGRVQFSVSDTGIGIAQEHLASIFEDWVQIVSSTQKRLRGSGLGLSLCKRYAELLGGNVSAQSQLGVGSTFTLTIPAVLALSETGHSLDARPSGSERLPT
ncbi:MAG: sensor histidine kinase [Aureliella sp.]